MSEVQASDPTEVLAYLHDRLDGHFSALGAARGALQAPVFALEHELGDVERRLLADSVRAVVSWGLPSRQRKLWLPFVVYAAEQGYDYVGDKYWPPFEAATPGWEYQHRDWLRSQYIKFADNYGGARPEGAFAGNFPIIAWPITHAVLPTYLQRCLAQLLFEFRTGLSTALLTDPDELGRRLAARARGYTERFRIFCSNTELLGQVAAALLAGEDDDSPYLVRSTLDRIVESLTREQQARQWLSSARRSASKVRASGFKSSGTRRGGSVKVPRATDPRLFLRFLDGAWNAYAEMPDLTVLSERLPHAYAELARSRAEVAGVRKKLATGRLAHTGQEVRFDTWPNPDKPFIQLEGGTEPVNQLIADQCVVSHGPWWLFRRQGAGLAIEVKGRMLRAGHRYVLVGGDSESAPSLAWSRTTPIGVVGVRAYTLDLPERLTDDELACLEQLGLAALSGVAVRPVGLVASAWDGEGSVEWLAAEPAIIGIRSELVPMRCLVTVSGELFSVEWPTGDSELVLALEGLEAGTHDVAVVLVGMHGQELASGSLLVTIRDPQIRPEVATPGEGIRLLASPAHPTLNDLWEEGATVAIDGPIAATADLCVTLRGSDHSELVSVSRTVKLPVDERAWSQLATSVRNEPRFRGIYEDAESSVITVASSGVGFASLTSERGFVPLRWRFKRAKDGSFVGVLADRTCGTRTTVEFYSVDSPSEPIPYAPQAPVVLPPRGGLLRASSDEAQVAEIAPTNPNLLLLTGVGSSSVPYGARSPAEIERLARGHRLWALARTPQDAFAARQRDLAMDAFSRAIALMLCGSHWAAIERKVATAQDPAEYLELMRRDMGVSEAHKALGDVIAYNLWHWLSLGNLAVGFTEAIAPVLKENGVLGQPTAGRFLLTLAGRPGYILSDWTKADRDYLLERVVGSPVLLRAARFAVLGTRILSDQESARQGF